MNVLLQVPSLNDKNALYVVIGIGLFLVIYIVIRPFMRRKNDPMDRPAAPMGRLSTQRTVERQMESLLVELSEMTRQMSAQLDSRSTKLEILLKDADERIAQLRQLSQNGSPLHGSPKHGSAVHGSAGRSTIIEAPEPEPAAPVSEIDPRHAEVYALADTGKSVSEIATALTRPSGEVELILALRPH